MSFSKAHHVILDIEGKVIPSSGDRPAPNPFAMVMDGGSDGEEEVKGQEGELEGVKRRRVSFSEKSAVILDIEGKIIASSGDKAPVVALGGGDKTEDTNREDETLNSGATGKQVLLRCSTPFELLYRTHRMMDGGRSSMRSPFLRLILLSLPKGGGCKLYSACMGAHKECLMFQSNNTNYSLKI